MRFSLAALVCTGLAFSAAAQPAAPADSTTTTAPGVGLTAPGASARAPKSFGQLGKNKTLTLLPVPVIFYQAETGLGYGLGALLSGRFSSDTLTRPSNARVQYWTTEQGQSLIQLVHSVYTPGEKFYLNGEISAYDISNLFYYGTGPNSKDADESATAYKLFIINQRVQKQLSPKLFFGALYRYTSTSDVVFDANTKDGSKTNIIYRDGSVTERQRQPTRVSGLGPVITYDTRDVPLAAFRGHLLDFSATINGTGLGSDYRFVRYQLDARHFQPIISTRTILALQFLGQVHTGDVPFRELGGIGANLGGSLYNNANLLRGIYEQRFRDRQMVMFQAELRQKLFWRIDGAVFGGVGNVSNQISGLDISNTKYAGGAGIRFNFIRRDRVNLRLDYAGGSGSKPGILFAIGEAF